jgi:hypothetical protein
LNQEPAADSAISNVDAVRASSRGAATRRLTFRRAARDAHSDTRAICNGVARRSAVTASFKVGDGTRSIERSGIEIELAIARGGSD